jgi:hypothetical protein
MKKIILFSLLASSYFGTAQTSTPAAPAAPADKEWDVSMYGFIRTDYIWDTRKSASVRELNLNLYPNDEAKLADGSDKNAVGQSNFLSVVSRLGTKVKGPNVWGAKMSGTLEGDFFGNTESSPSSIGMFRLRHAFVNMDWAKSSLTLGQTWYPNFIPECFPGVANFNTGILFNPFGWATQARFKQNLTKQLSIAVTAYKEREFTTNAATDGTTTATQNSATINSSIPTFNGHLQFRSKNWLAGVQFEYKSIQPLTVSNGKMTTEKVTSTSIMGYAKYSNDAFSVKAYGISGGDMSNLVMLGGYVGYTTGTEVQKFEASKTSSFWLDIASNGKKVAPGLFFGMTNNNGTGHTLAAGETAAYYMRGVSATRVIDRVWRASARVDFKQNKFRVSPELEYTSAVWGDLNTNGNGKADANQVTVGNMRAMVSCVYTF